MKYHSKDHDFSEGECIHCDWSVRYSDLVKSVGEKYIVKLNKEMSAEEQAELHEYIYYIDDIIDIICDRYSDIMTSCYLCDEGPDGMDIYKSQKYGL